MIRRVTGGDGRHLFRSLLAAFCLFLLAGRPALAQSSSAPAETCVTTTCLADRIKFYRWQEDYSDLATAEVEGTLTGLAALKYRKVANGHISFGGQYRLRVEGLDHPDFELLGAEGFTSVNHRFLAHADWRPSERVRAFTQLGYYRETGRPGPPSAIRDSGLDLQQGFVDFALGSDWNSYVRLGRQEIVLPSSRFLGSREGPNQRLAFDGAFLKTEVANLDVSSFLAAPVSPNCDAFGDRSSAKDRFGGVYVSQPRDWGQFDAYYLYRKDDGLFQYGSGIQRVRRHSLGSRILVNAGSWQFDWEAAYQMGSFGNQSVNAYGVATQTYLSLNALPGSPVLALRANMASGDADASDSRLGTFNGLYANLSYFTAVGTYAPGNAVDVLPGVLFTPHHDVRLTFEANRIWRLRETDGIYAAGYRSLLPPVMGQSNRVSTYYAVDARWDVRPHVELRLNLTKGRADRLVQQSGGRSLTFVLLAVDTKF